ncbi:MAG: hypothetical protein JW969_08825 [Spirochaetales bacterium]|nr:hypothetical protein [Spirochaetales bacterium]
MPDKLDNLIDRVNIFLRNQGFHRLKNAPKDISMLFELAIREIWKLKDKDKIETLSVEVAQMLKPFFGGKRIEDAMEDIFDKLKKEDGQKAVEAQKQAKLEEDKKLKERMNDPNYVPTFEELMKSKKMKK